MTPPTLPTTGADLIESPPLARRDAMPRWHLLYGVLGIAVAILVGRSFYLQVFSGSRLLRVAEGNRVAILAQEAPRGILYDKDRRQLVENIANTDVVVDPAVLPDQENQEQLVHTLAELLSLSSEDVQRVFITAHATQRVTILQQAIGHDIVLAVEEALPNLPGIRLATAAVRKYDLADAAAHLLGYTSAVTSDELTAFPDLRPTDATGKTGLEKQYDSVLRGEQGATYSEINATGRSLAVLGEKAPRSGQDLYLTIDSELQQFIYSLFAERAGKKQEPVRGAVVALDPRSGAIRALVSYPSFDPNSFSQPALRDKAGRVVTAEDQPLFNRATDGQYPPGSTIKPLLASAALEEGIVNSSTTIVSTGGISVGPWHFPDWKAGGHGPTTITKALAESVNTFFYIVAGGKDEMTGLGVDRIVKYLGAFGWGAASGIDMPSEATGFLPSIAWKENTKKEAWYIGDTYHLGIGQGDVLVTPLQVSVATAAIANGGTVYKPYTVERVGDSKPATHERTTHNLPLHDSHLAVVRAGMRLAVTDGSAKNLAALPVLVAGKTGTAQVGGSENTHAWFTSFAPYEQPELVVTVLLEEGGEGDKDAVPLAREIWQWWAEHHVTSR